ncbi:unnamed protein product [Prorocentrum cordatum]|uniref:Fe2OG dioxygenase domain-containing protein n=1 Tax=Prorocentrum cordatum TaxID=2364126 RepID=A0ABN9YJH8_9DINO|nr:unnamed protein product [Polarella glacialis]
MRTRMCPPPSAPQAGTPPGLPRRPCGGVWSAEVAAAAPRGGRARPRAGAALAAGRCERHRINTSCSGHWARQFREFDSRAYLNRESREHFTICRERLSRAPHRRQPRDSRDCLCRLSRVHHCALRGLRQAPAPLPAWSCAAGWPPGYGIDTGKGRDRCEGRSSMEWMDQVKGKGKIGLPHAQNSQQALKEFTATWGDLGPERRPGTSAPTLFLAAPAGPEPLGYNGAGVRYFYRGSGDASSKEARGSTLTGGAIATRRHRWTKQLSSDFLTGAAMPTQVGGARERADAAARRVGSCAEAKQAPGAPAAVSRIDLAGAFDRAAPQFAIQLPASAERVEFPDLLRPGAGAAGRRPGAAPKLCAEGLARDDSERLVRLCISGEARAGPRPLARPRPGVHACVAVPASRRELVRLGAWRGYQFVGAEGGAEWALLRGLLSREEARLVLSRMPPLDAFEAKPDSIDGAATHEFYVYKAARLLHRPLDDVMRPAMDRAMLFVRARYACDTCVVCFSLVRRYLEGERRGLHAHQDMQASVSVVFTLNSEDYEGGLFLMSNYSAAQSYLPLRTGDAVVHQADLLHGVAVSRGNRWSWSLWIKPEAECNMFVTVKGHFTAADSDGDGRLSIAEAEEFARRANLQRPSAAPGRGREVAAALLRVADMDGDGLLDAYEAFTVVFKSTMPSMPPRVR